MYYLIGDIHGCLDNLVNLYNKIKNLVEDSDTLIFLGDYIDRGLYSYEVIEFLINISKDRRIVFLKGNHESMFLRYKESDLDAENYFDNGGMTTLRSYKANGAHGIPLNHQLFYDNLLPYFETDDFIAVHAGFNPKIPDIKNQDEHDILWIRDSFFRSERIWEKTVIFGHTICSILHGNLKKVYLNDITNIIGLDTGACYGGTLSCLRWPDKKIFQG